MRTLDEVLAEIVGYYRETDLTLAEATEKAGPFDDLDDEGRERALFVGVNHLANVDAAYLREHPVGDDDEPKRSYLGRFQLRPGDGAKASAVYPHLSMRFDVGGLNRRVIEFTSDDIGYVRDKYAAISAGAARKGEFFAWLEGEVVKRSKVKVSDLPKSVLAEADERAGEVFK